MKNKRKNLFLFTSYLTRLLLGILCAIFVLLLVPTSQTTKIKEKLFFLYSQPVVHTVDITKGDVGSESDNCDFTTSEIESLNSDCSFYKNPEYKNSGLRGGGNVASTRNATNKKCKLGFCLSLSSKSLPATDKATLNIGAGQSNLSQTDFSLQANAANRQASTGDRQDQIELEEMKNLKQLFDSDKSNWSEDQTRDFYRKMLTSEAIFNKKFNRKILVYPNGKGSVKFSFKDNFVTMGGHNTNYKNYKTDKASFETRVEVLNRNGLETSCPHAFYVREVIRAPKLERGQLQPLEDINARMEGDHPVGSGIYLASERDREKGEVVAKPWLTHSAHGYYKGEEEMDFAFPNGTDVPDGEPLLAKNRTSFAAGDNINTFFTKRGESLIRAIRRIPSSLFTPEVSRRDLEASELKAITKEKKRHKWEKKRAGFTEDQMLYDLHAGLSANENFIEVERLTNNINRDIEMCRNSHGRYVFDRAKTIRYTDAGVHKRY